MAQRRDTGKQNRWLDLLERWQRSALTIREFCWRQRISEASFYSWRRVLRERGLLHDEATEPAAATPAFVKLAVDDEASAASAVEVVLGQRLLRVRPGFDADMLLQLVRLLEDGPC